MHIAFYAPLKPPSHPVASGDRAMARLLIAALERAGHEVTLASRLRTRDALGDPSRQERLRSLGAQLAERFLRRVRRCGHGPDLWFTYHLYDKAPDWIGPTAADALDIPYVVAEASISAKRRDGPWRSGHAAVLAALRRADAVIGLNSADRAGIRDGLAASDRYHDMRPFISVAPFAAAIPLRAGHRNAFAHRHRLDPHVPWLVTVAMMRPGDKLASYRVLATALTELTHYPWHLLVIGHGAVCGEVHQAFAPIAHRITWLGLLEPSAIPAYLAASDLYVWPAINEAYGMALLEAQAAGLPVLAGASGGVPDIVADGVTGRLVPPGNVAEFRNALGELVASPSLCRRLGAAAAHRVSSLHDITAAAARLDEILRHVVDARGRT